MKRLLLLVAVVALLIAAISLAYNLSDPVFRAFHRVQNSMTSDQVLALCGKPDVYINSSGLKNYSFSVGRNPQAVNWMVYESGTDTYAIGFDKDGKVVEKVSGGP